MIREGLKELYTNNKMILHNTDCQHQEFKLSKCFKKMTGLIQLLIPYLTDI